MSRILLCAVYELGMPAPVINDVTSTSVGRHSLGKQLNVISLSSMYLKCFSFELFVILYN